MEITLYGKWKGTSRKNKEEEVVMQIFIEEVKKDMIFYVAEWKCELKSQLHKVGKVVIMMIATGVIVLDIFALAP